MSAPTTLEVDYVVVGAGAMGMAFTDALLSTNTKATIALVDRYARPGGHWTIAYPYVRLHQPSKYYGVNSKHLGQDRIDQVGLNKGMFELASADEVCGYFSQVVQDTFLPSGRLQYFPKSVWDGERSFKSILTGKIYEAGPKTKIVDATYMKVVVPAMRLPPFPVAAGVDVVTPTGMTTLPRSYANYTVIGAGKTGIDACLWLMTMGISPDAISWIMPRDAWLFDRSFFQEALVEQSPEALANYAKAILSATSYEDMFHRLVTVGQAVRIDESRRATMFRCGTVSKIELGMLRQLKNIIRLGRVQAIEDGKLVLEQGTVPFELKDTVFIDCSADGLERRPPVPIFAGNKITLQPVRYCQQVFSSAFLGHVEGHYTDDELKNSLSEPIPHPDEPIGLVRGLLQSNRNSIAWAQHQATVDWLNSARLDWSVSFKPLGDPDLAKRADAKQKLEGLLKLMITKLEALWEQGDGEPAKGGANGEAAGVDLSNIAI